MQSAPRLPPRHSKSRVLQVCIAFGLFCAGLYTFHMGRALQLAIPLGCMGIAIVLLRRDRPAIFIRFVLWNWLLAAFVRRIVDDRCGFVDQSLIIATPMLVSAASIVGIWPKRVSILRTQKLIPIFLCLGGFLYGACVCFVLKPSPKLLYAALQWTSPILFALYLCSYPERFILYRRVVRSTLIHATLVLGVYGIYQFLVMPSWDVLWLTNVMEFSQATAFGRPEAGQLRIWSTLNAPGFLAVLMVTGILLLLFESTRWKFLAMVLAVINLALTLIRTEWVGLCIGLALLLVALKFRQLLRFIIAGVLFCCSLPLLLYIPYFDKVVNDRVSTFNDISKDTSYQDRKELLEHGTKRIYSNPLGTDHLTELRLDNGLFDLLLSLGWPGGIAYLAGLAWIMLNPYTYRRNKGLFIRSCHARSVALTVTLASGNILIEFPGAILWLCLALYITGAEAEANHGRRKHRGGLALPDLPIIIA